MSLTLLSKPKSLFTEEIKKLRANIKFSQVNDDVKVIMVTSSVQGEGKSAISANLGVAFAQNGEKVIVVDCDLRKGKQNELFEILDKDKKGLSTLLLEKDLEKTYKSFIHKTSVTGLDLIFAGQYPPNPSELLSSLKFKKLIELVRATYDLIILDCPPVTGLNDALVVSRCADKTLIVVKAGSTPVELLSNTKKALEGINAKIAGVVLNQINAKGTSYYYSNEYYYVSDEKGNTIKKRKHQDNTNGKK